MLTKILKFYKNGQNTLKKKSKKKINKENRKLKTKTKHNIRNLFKKQKQKSSEVIEGKVAEGVEGRGGSWIAGGSRMVGDVEGPKGRWVGGSEGPVGHGGRRCGTLELQAAARRDGSGPKMGRGARGQAEGSDGGV